MKIKGIIFCGVFGAALLSCTIVKNDAAKKEGEGSPYGFSIGTIDPKQYANDIWDSMIIPRVESMAVDFNSLIAEMESDEAKASGDHGYRLKSGWNLSEAVEEYGPEFLSR
jgi:predicted lipoprotein